MSLRAGAVPITSEAESLQIPPDNSVRIETLLGQLKELIVAGKLSADELEQISATAARAHFAAIQNQCADLGIEADYLNPKDIIPSHSIDDKSRLTRLVNAVHENQFIPPLIVFELGTTKLLLEGHHRRQAHIDAAQPVPCIIVKTNEQLRSLLEMKFTYTGWLKKYESIEKPLDAALDVVEKQGSWPDPDHSSKAKDLLGVAELCQELRSDWIWRDEEEELHTICGTLMKLDSRDCVKAIRETVFRDWPRHASSAVENDLLTFVRLDGWYKLWKSSPREIPDLRVVYSGSSLHSLPDIKDHKYLDIGDSDIQSIERLSDLKELEVFNCDNTRVINLRPLSRLKKLRHLSIEGTRVNQLTHLAKCTSLEFLSVANTAVSDITILAGLTRLQLLDISYSKVRDLSPLADLSSLELLVVDGEANLDFLPLSKIPNLEIALLIEGYYEYKLRYVSGQGFVRID